jgi:hypothetical protein
MKKPKQIDENNLLEVTEELQRVFVLLQYFASEEPFMPRTSKKNEKIAWAKQRIKQLVIAQYKLENK